MYSSNRLIRGGDWNNNGASNPVSYRNNTDPSYYNTNIGFRPCSNTWRVLGLHGAPAVQY